MMTLLWSLVLVLSIAVVVLSLILLGTIRQVGVLHERIAPLGAMVTSAGPAIGSTMEPRTWPLLDGTLITLPAKGKRHTLLFFLSPKCPVCKKLLPAIFDLRRRETDWLDLVLSSDGDAVQHRAFVQKEGLGDIPYILSGELGHILRVSNLPFATILDSAGKIVSKGLVNSREQIESLLTAAELNQSGALTAGSGNAPVPTVS